MALMRLSLPQLFTCRQVLHGMIITSFIVYGLNVAIISMAIVDMVAENNQNNSFMWNENEKQNTMGLDLWGDVFAKMINWKVSEIIGPRLMIGCSMLLVGIVTIASPQIVFCDYYLFLVSRFVVGSLLATLFPSVFLLADQWFPSVTYSKFLSWTKSEFLGVAISNLLCGVIVSRFGWISAFYVFGAMTILWSLLWFLLIYNSPEQHPRVLETEKSEIREQRKGCPNNIKIKLTQAPWKKILTSAAVWAIVLTEATDFFIYVTLMQQVPSYLNEVLKFEEESVGLYSSIFFLGKYLSAIIFTTIINLLVKTNKISTITSRKISVTSGLLLPSLIVLLMAFYGDNLFFAMPVLLMVVSLSGANFGGHLPNITDIAPGSFYAVFGLATGFASIGGYFSSTVVSVLLENGHSFQHWQYLFYIMCGVGVTGWITYMSFSSKDQQNWDRAEEQNPSNQKV